MTGVNMGTQDIQGYTGYTECQGKHGSTGYTRVYSMTRVNMGNRMPG